MFKKNIIGIILLSALFILVGCSEKQLTNIELLRETIIQI